jgi:hypothetical protein
MDLLMLSDDYFIDKCKHDGNFSLIVRYDNLLPSGLFVNDDISMELLSRPCSSERLSYKRLIDVLFLKNSANFDKRVQIWANFGHTWIEALK